MTARPRLEQHADFLVMGAQVFYVCLTYSLAGWGFWIHGNGTSQ